MNKMTCPTTFRKPSSRVLRGPVPPHFEQFYRESLRYRFGFRIRQLEVATRYRAWAEQNEAPAMHDRELARAMRHIGHSHYRSNITYFGEAQLAQDVPDLVDNFPPLPSEGLALDPNDQGLLRSIDRTVAELAKLRRLVEVR